MTTWIGLLSFFLEISLGLKKDGGAPESMIVVVSNLLCVSRLFSHRCSRLKLSASASNGKVIRPGCGCMSGSGIPHNRAGKMQGSIGAPECAFVPWSGIVTSDRHDNCCTDHFSVAAEAVYWNECHHNPTVRDDWVLVLCRGNRGNVHGSFEAFRPWYAGKVVA